MQLTPYMQAVIESAADYLKRDIKDEENNALNWQIRADQARERLATYKERLAECEAALNTIAHDND